MRQPAYAGTFYESSPIALKKQIEECFLGDKGPGVLPGKRTGDVKAAIVPHAGYMYSGKCAAWAYKALGESKLPDMYLLIGPNHHNSESGMSIESTELPFGTLRSDQAFARELEKKDTIRINEDIHRKEHSLEVQLPFLQYINEKQIEKVKVLQILIGQDLDLKKAALDIQETLMDTGKKVILLASSDFTHYGINYHYVPFIDDIQQKIYDLDKRAIDFITKGDESGFLNFVRENEMTICGAKAIALLLKIINAKGELEAYYTSGDMTGSYRNSVSYASILFK